jgi:hypothetical protein
VTAGRLHGTELVGIAGAALLVGGLLLPWYATDASSSHSQVGGRAGSLTGWDAHPVLRWLLLAAATAPFVLAWIILRGHALSWARGEMTIVTSIAAFGLVAYNGLVDRPGEIGISLRAGRLVAVAGTLVMAGAAARRSAEAERPRKPPGTIQGAPEHP